MLTENETVLYAQWMDITELKYVDVNNDYEVTLSDVILIICNSVILLIANLEKRRYL